MPSRIRQKWRIQRVMAVPANWQGTPDRFYHFLLGYLVPLLIWQQRSAVRDIAVRDSGPHNPWFELLDPETSIEILPPGMMLERYLSHRQERVVFHDWDNPTRFHIKSLARARQIGLARIDNLSSLTISTPRITVLDRRSSLEHYQGAGSETPGGAAEWRSLPNVDEIAASLGSIGKVRILDTARLTPFEQVRELGSTDVLVAQHGGGVSNMLWMSSGASVVEILPPRPPTIDMIFRNLAAARQLGYRAIPQEDDHAAVEPALVKETVAELIKCPRSFVPTATGSLAMRVWRQRPRRL